mmetsp:Transcript_30851/g.46812  ORF Transcript_30851/g.46812 Transcript_30851/m.46812 type:complete len:955 (+) Transcript_30851:54-2918(+)
MYSPGQSEEVKVEEVSDDELAAPVTLDDVKQATPMEDEAVTTILESIDHKVDSISTVDPPLKNQNSMKLSLSGKMKQTAMKIRAMHRMAFAVQVVESEKSSYHEEEKLLQHNSMSSGGAMGDTTMAMVANANILLQRKKEATEKDNNSSDIEKGKDDDKKPNKSMTSSGRTKQTMDNLNAKKEELKEIYRGLQPQRNKIQRSFRCTFGIGLLLFVVAVITFYALDPQDLCLTFNVYQPPTVAPSPYPTEVPVVGNATITTPTFPPTPYPTPTSAPKKIITIVDCTTISWFCLFLMRQMVTFYLALFVQLIVIDVFCLQFRWVTRCLGPLIILGLIQSKGWPFVAFAWSLINFALNYGTSQFAHHWLFWVGWGLFNEENPAGNVTHSTEYRNILFTLLCLGIATAIKRLVFGLKFGAQTYKNFNEQLTEVMEEVVMISEVAHLSKQIDMNLINGNSSSRNSEDASVVDWGKRFAAVVTSGATGVLSVISNDEDDDDSSEPIVLEKEDLTVSQRDSINKLVGEWEEPKITTNSDANQATLDDIVSFSQTLLFINNTFPFTTSFGNARNREACIQSAQQVFTNLQQHTSSTTNNLPFETIAIVARKPDGSLNEPYVRKLLRTFRPDRQGNLTLLDFCKSVDNTYKKLRMLQASIKNASQIDNAAEKLYNVVFYVAYFGIVQSGLLGMHFFTNVLGLLFAIVTPLSFALSSACGNYVEGVMLVLYRKPFGIGDRIALSAVDVDTSKTGSATWFVENVDLFTTTARFSITNEVATLSNSSLAPCRIINANRSPKAVIRITLRFGVHVPMTKVDQFYIEIERYVKERPREFFQLNGLFASSIEVQKGYIEYVLAVQHLESWQNMGSVWQSKVGLTRQCHTLSRELDMKFVTPTLPVEIVKFSESSATLEGETSTTTDAIAASLVEAAVSTTTTPSIPISERVDGGDDREDDDKDVELEDV